MIDRDAEWWARTHRAAAWWARTLAFTLTAVAWYRAGSVEGALFGLVTLFGLLYIAADLEERALSGELAIERGEVSEA